jgi:hypothetical protein
MRRPLYIKLDSVRRSTSLFSFSFFHLLPCWFFFFLLLLLLLLTKQKSLVTFSRLFRLCICLPSSILLSYSSCFITSHNWTNWYDIRIKNSRERGPLYVERLLLTGERTGKLHLDWISLFFVVVLFVFLRFIFFIFHQINCHRLITVRAGDTLDKTGCNAEDSR